MQRDGTTTRHERGTGVRAGSSPTDRAYAPPYTPGSSQPAPPAQPKDAAPGGSSDQPPPVGTRGPEPRPGVSPRVQRISLAVLTVYLALVGWLVLRPVTAGWTYPANLTPFASVEQALAVGGLAGVRQLAAGLLPLAPLGVLLPLAGGRLRTGWLPSFLHTAGGSALLATALEILKGWTPGHVLNVDNILLGTLGVAATHLAFVPAGRSVLRRRATEAPAAPAAAAVPEPSDAPVPTPGTTPAPQLSTVAAPLGAAHRPVLRG
ncbi:VanZ family protein, partial [Saccharothrix sp. ST-888]|uniref:VanZ family protein n=1 Tax=Saccharothrix sp. ST-888 TaxID=1427391 RepID=UPI0018CE2939